MLSLASKVTSDDIFYGHSIYLNIEIPQFGTKHSLNIAVCGGLVLWDLFSKMNQS